MTVRACIKRQQQHSLEMLDMNIKITCDRLKVKLIMHQAMLQLLSFISAETPSYKANSPAGDTNPKPKSDRDCCNNSITQLPILALPKYGSTMHGKVKQYGRSQKDHFPLEGS